LCPPGLAYRGRAVDACPGGCRAQLGCDHDVMSGQNPKVMSICIGESHLAVLPQLLADLRDAAAFAAANPGTKLEGTTSVYGAAATIPDELLDSVLRSYCDTRMRVKPARAASSDGR
jgi:hypothetical protein